MIVYYMKYNYIVYMKKKSERNFYALATSSISDIPQIKSNKISQNQYYNDTSDYKYGNSPFNDSVFQKSHRDQSINLNFSISKPFYQQFTPSIQVNQYHQYNKRSSNFSDYSSSMKLNNNKRIQYSYSNFVILFNHIGKINKKIKQNIFNNMKNFIKRQNKFKTTDVNTNHSQISRTTNETFNQNTFYNKKINKKRIQDRQQCIESANLIKRWLQSFNFIAQYSQQKIYESSSVFGSSAKKDRLLSQKFNLTQNNSYSRSNQNIQESLVYTIDNNNDQIRRDGNSFVFDSHPTFKKIPKSHQKIKYSHQYSTQLQNPHSFIFKDKQLLKYFIKQIKLKVTEPLLLPKMFKLKQKNLNIVQQNLQYQQIDKQQNLNVFKQKRPVALDNFIPSKADMDDVNELQIIKQIMNDGSYLNSQPEHIINSGNSKYSNASSVEQNPHYASINQEKNIKNNDSQIHQNIQSGIKSNISANQKQSITYGPFDVSSFKNLQESQHIIKTAKIIQQNAPININHLSHLNNNDSIIKIIHPINQESKLKIVKSQQKIQNNVIQHQKLIKIPNQRRLTDLQNDRMRIQYTQRTNNNYHEKPIYYTNKNIPQYSSVILTQVPNPPNTNEYMLQNNKLMSPKKSRQKIIIHPTIKQIGSVVSQRRLVHNDNNNFIRQHSNQKNQLYKIKNPHQPCIYYQQSPKNIVNTELVKSHALKTNSSKLIEHRSISQRLNIAPRLNIVKIPNSGRQQIVKSPQKGNILSSKRMINFPQRKNKRQIFKTQGNHIIHNPLTTQIPPYHNFTKSNASQNLKIKHPVIIRNYQERPTIQNEYQLISRQQKINYPQNKINHHINSNNNLYLSNNQNVSKIYSLSSDHKIYQRPPSSIKVHIRQPLIYTSNQSINQSQNYSNYTDNFSVRTQTKRPKSNHKKIQITLRSK